MAKLTPQQIEDLKQLLESGQDIPEDYRLLLFPPQRREYELVYAGKEREQDILANTWSVPLQALKTFGVTAPQSSWTNRLIFGDNLQVMKTLLKRKEQGELVNADGTLGVKLVYIDPPFATRREFQGNKDERAYQDKVLGAEFLEFLRKRLVLLRELLAPNGSIFVHLDHKKGHYLKVLLDEVFGEHNYRNGIARIKCNPKNYTSTTFGNVHDLLYFYSRSSETEINKVYLERVAAQILEDFPYVDKKNGKRYKTTPLHARGKRKGESGKPWRGLNPPEGNHWRYIHKTLDDLDNAGLIEWSDSGNPRKKIYAEDSEGYLLQDIWDFKDPGERNARYPTEKCDDLLRHIIRASSKEGDIVLDAFAGSGTTIAVAEELGRKWIGIDCGKLAIYTVQKRLLSLGAKCKPFTLFNAGLYDYTRMRDLSWEDYRAFATQLFQIRDEPHTLGGVKLDGYKGAADVLIFNYRAHPGVVLDEAFVANLHMHLGSKARDEFFIVAPAASVTFLEDYIDHGDTRYYVLRIPYSIIDEIHDRPFMEMRQPVDETEVNSIVEAIGFDFIQPPKVEATYSVEAGKELFTYAVVTIEKFSSETMIKNPRDFADRETLSMVMVDYDYKGNGEGVFDLDAVFYRDQIEKDGWKFRLMPQQIGSRVMLIYIDIFGNELRELKTPADFGLKPEDCRPKRTKKDAPRDEDEGDSDADGSGDTSANGSARSPNKLKAKAKASLKRSVAKKAKNVVKRRTPLPRPKSLKRRREGR